MKSITFGILAVLVIASCENRDWQPRRILVTREVHVDFETGAKLGETTFTYDEENLVVREYFLSATNPAEDLETRYEYNDQHRVTKKMVRYPQQSPVFYITENNYVDGLLHSETTYSDNSLLGYRTLYFYSGLSVADSSQHYSYSTIDTRYIYNSSVYYTYNESKRLIKATDNHGYVTLYKYEGPRVAAICDVRVGTDGMNYEDCLENKYNDVGMLISVSTTSAGNSQLNEVLTYEGLKLREKLLYRYPAYEPGNTVHIRQIRYEYNID